jgi:predicted ATPase
MSPSTLWVGDPAGARRHGEQGMTLYDREQDRSLAFLYGGHDAGVCCRMHSGLALWFLGYPQAAVERSRAGMALATELAHVGTVANALPFAGMLHQLRRDVGSTREAGESLIALSTEHGFRQWLAFGRILEGWVQAQEGRGEVPIAQLRDDIAAYRATGNDLYWPYFLWLLASTQLQHGETADGLDTVATALGMAEGTGSPVLEADLHRLRGELLLARDPVAAPDAEIAFRQAIDIARRQGVKSWELRAASSLGRLWQRQGKREDARRLLGDVYGWFTEGFDTADLEDAKTLLDAVS